MKQTIEIEVPDGKKAIWKDNKVIFEDIKPQLPKTWEEYVTFHFPVDKFPENHYVCAKTSLFSCHTTKQHLALMQLHQLRDCYRQGWEPCWEYNARNYCIIFKNNVPIISINTNMKRFLTFQSNEIAEEFLKNFHNLIEQAGDLI